MSRRKGNEGSTEQERQGILRGPVFRYGPYIAVIADRLNVMIAFHHKKMKPQNMHDWGSESAIDPKNPLVYIQAIFYGTPD